MVGILKIYFGHAVVPCVEGVLPLDKSLKRCVSKEYLPRGVDAPWL